MLQDIALQVERVIKTLLDLRGRLGMLAVKVKELGCSNVAQLC